jgi:hypothetical protein
MRLILTNPIRPARAVSCCFANTHCQREQVATVQATAGSHRLRADGLDEPAAFIPAPASAAIVDRRRVHVVIRPRLLDSILTLHHVGSE